MSKPQHPAEDLLFQSFNGELAEAEARRISQHLNECWECRTRWEQWHLARADYMLYRQEMQDAAPAPPLAWGSFQARLHTLANELGTPRQHAFFRSSFVPAAGAWKRIAGGAVAAFALAAALVMYFERPPAASAAVILARAASAENAAFSVAGIAVHRVVTIEQRSAGMGQVMARRRVESWQTAGRKRSARRIFAENGRLLAGEWSRADGSCMAYEIPQADPGILSPASMWRLAPSTEDFRAVTDAAGTTSVEVSPSAYVVHYRAAQAAGTRILAATLTIRRGDVHAVEQTLRVDEQGAVSDYHYAEDSFESRTEDGISAAVFQPDSELLPAAPALRAALPVASASTGAGSPEPAGMAAPSPSLELDVLERLDRANALLDNNVQVTHLPDGGVKIDGIVAGPERRSELLQSLGPLAQNGAVRFSVLTAREAQGLQTPPSGPVSLQQVEIDQSRTPADADLRAFFSTRGIGDPRQNLAQFSADAIDRAVQAQLHAHVLTLVAASVSPADLASLDADHHRQWRSLIRRHAAVVERELLALHSQLQPVFEPSDRHTATPAPAAGDAELLALSNRLFEVVSQIDDMVRRSFSSSRTQPGVVPVKQASFWELLTTAESLSLEVK